MDPSNGNQHVDLVVRPLVVPHTVLLGVPEPTSAGLDAWSVIRHLHQSAVNQKLVSLGLVFERTQNLFDDLVVPLGRVVVAVCFCAHYRCSSIVDNLSELGLSQGLG